MDIYDLYKPLRNRLTTYALLPSLSGVFPLLQHLQFDRLLVPAMRWPLYPMRTAMAAGAHERTMDLITRELILNALLKGSLDMNHWDGFADLANRVRDIDNTTWGRLESGFELIQYEILRLARRQFPWQARPNSRTIASYLRLYGKPRLAELMTAAFGMSRYRGAFRGSIVDDEWDALVGGAAF